MNDKWLSWEPEDVTTEQCQALDEGRDLAGLDAEFTALAGTGDERAPDLQERFNALLDRVGAAPMRADYAYVEPSDLDGIRAARPSGPRRMDLPADDAILADKIHGAWLGRCCGCLLGKPIEGIHTTQLHPLVQSTGADMLTDYPWRMGPTHDACAAAGRPKLLEFGSGIAHMPIDDDTNYTITGMLVVKEHGLGFEPRHMANVWMKTTPILATCTAERVAYRNFVNQVAPPASATLRNPYREWIGAQIRADFFGYVAIGRPELAAGLAWRDACISHVRNGIYGEMWVAAMLAAAAIETDPGKIVEIGLSEVPDQSRFAEAIRDVLAWRAEGLDYDAAWKRIHARWSEARGHHWCHTISNAQVVAVGLLWSEGDFELGVTRAVWPAFDTDCNGATVGSILGMRLGAKALPEKWTSLLNDTVHSSVEGYQIASISESAGEMFSLFQKHRDR